MSICGWTGKILRVDLSSGKISHLDTAQYVPKFIGGLGIAAKIAWDELRPGVGPFDPENMLMIMAGPLTGTLASGAGRVEVVGIAPQQRPPAFSRSGMGGHWGAELKYAGFDGIVVGGVSAKPVYVWIDNSKVEIRDAGELWGTGTYSTTMVLRAIHGPKTRVVSCGQAGENLSRIAVIQTETGNAAGQGGYGGVMGSKRLKAIAVRGTKGVKVARPAEFLELCLCASREGQSPSRSRGAPTGPQQGLGYRTRKCGFCITPCVHMIYMNIPGQVSLGLRTSARHCWGYRASLGTELEARAITSEYGINGWEVSYGMIPWLQLCRQKKLIDAIDGIEIPVPDRPIEYLRDVAPYPREFLTMLLRQIAYREGAIGDGLADGTCYAAERLFEGRGKRLLNRIYPRHAGQTEHWAGHWAPGGTVYWPWWLPLYCSGAWTPGIQPATALTSGPSTYRRIFPRADRIEGPFHWRRCGPSAQGSTATRTYVIRPSSTTPGRRRPFLPFGITTGA